MPTPIVQNEDPIYLLLTVLSQSFVIAAAAAAAKSLQSCPTLCDPIDGSPPGSPVPGILQARTLEWVAISFSNAWKWKVKGKSLSRVRLLATPWTAAHQAPPSMGFSRQEYWSGVPLPSPSFVISYLKMSFEMHRRYFPRLCCHPQFEVETVGQNPWQHAWKLCSKLTYIRLLFYICIVFNVCIFIHTYTHAYTHTAIWLMMNKQGNTWIQLNSLQVWHFSHSK